MNACRFWPAGWLGRTRIRDGGRKGARALHRNLLFSPAAKYTALTKVFSGRLARGIHNRMMSELKAHEAQLPRYPIQYWVASTIKAAAQAQGRSDLLALWSSQAAPLLKHRRASGLMHALEQETTVLLARGKSAAK